jgi:hypothetical protein
LAEWLDTDHGAPEQVRQVVFDVGVDLCRQYLTNPDIEYDQACTDTMPFFFGDEDDEDDDTVD